MTEPHSTDDMLRRVYFEMAETHEDTLGTEVNGAGAVAGQTVTADETAAQRPTDPVAQLVAAHHAGYYQAIDRLLHGWGRYTAWRNSTDYPRPSDGPREVHAAHLAAYLADTYETPA